MEQNKDDLSRLLTPHAFLYFLAAPTLCFQFIYPRTLTIRKWFLVKRTAEFILLVFTNVAVMLQYIYPILLQSDEILRGPNVSITKIITYVNLLVY